MLFIGQVETMIWTNSITDFMVGLEIPFAVCNGFPPLLMYLFSVAVVTTDLATHSDHSSSLKRIRARMQAGAEAGTSSVHTQPTFLYKPGPSGQGEPVHRTLSPSTFPTVC